MSEEMILNSFRIMGGTNGRSLPRPSESARKIVDDGQVLHGEKRGRTDDAQITYFKNCTFWSIGAARAKKRLIDFGLIEEKLGGPVITSKVHFFLTQALPCALKKGAGKSLPKNVKYIRYIKYIDCTNVDMFLQLP